jgi:hypothetical protein
MDDQLASECGFINIFISRYLVDNIGHLSLISIQSCCLPTLYQCPTCFIAIQWGIGCIDSIIYWSHCGLWNGGQATLVILVLNWLFSSLWLVVLYTSLGKCVHKHFETLNCLVCRKMGWLSILCDVNWFSQIIFHVASTFSSLLCFLIILTLINQVTSLCAFLLQWMT